MIYFILGEAFTIFRSLKTGLPRKQILRHGMWAVAWLGCTVTGSGSEGKGGEGIREKQYKSSSPLDMKQEEILDFTGPS